MKTFTNIFYIILARDSDGSQLKKSFKEEFQSQDANVQITIVDREECIKKFKLTDTNDEVHLVHSILQTVPSRSFVFIDEANMNTKSLQSSYDWSSLRNTTEDTCLVMAFKPVVELRDQAESVEPKLPQQAEVVKLTRSYRQSVSVFNSIQKYLVRGVRKLKADVNPVNIVSGPKPRAINYDGVINDIMRTFCLYKLKDYEPKDVKILYSPKKSDDARRMFENTRFSDCLIEGTSFIGCEAPVVVMFFSDEDRNFHFMEMASRAQIMVGFVLPRELELHFQL